MSRWESLEARFEAHIQQTATCWYWTGALNSVGYGTIYGRGHRHYAHRLAWMRSNGRIPLGKCVLHRCDNPRCVNPAHLFLGTKADNTHDMWAKGRQGGSPADNARKDRCSCHGLPLNEMRRCALNYGRPVPA